MARRTKEEESIELMNQFFAEAEEKYVALIKSTRQPKRRRTLLHELDALDTWKGQYYSFLTGRSNA